tara:strand:+ start:663 stop:1361 length:699 start_codon:yes stop_codon:yes gene_type:complete
MIDINDLQAIEKYFADNLESPLFPILGELYFKNGDYNRSEKVCEIGLKSNPDSSVGYYLLAKITLIKEKLHKAEKLLEKSIKYNSINLSSMNLLFFVQKELKRSKIIIKKNVINILSLDPNHNECKNWLEKHFKTNNSNSKKIENTPNKKLFKKDKSQKDNKEKIIYTNQVEQENLDINESLASMTLFNIYKSQGYYQQALQVLNILKKKEKNNKKIEEEINILKKLIQESK